MEPVKKVAVIGAGISGVTSAAHLLRHGVEAVVFERSAVSGGVWHFDPRPDRDPPYPSPQQTKKNGDSAKALDDIALAHAPPGPCYEGLRNNVPTTLMRSSLHSWPEGTPDHVGHYDIEEYVQSLSRSTGVEDITLYNTRVEEATKSSPDGQWTVRTKTLKQSPDGSHSFEGREWQFDAVIVAAGHYHIPLIPELPGLAEWKENYPGQVFHSKGYRSARPFKDQNVLIIGAGVSSLDISKELGDTAHKVYQSSRGGKFDLDASFLPANAERVGGISEFKLDEGKVVEAGSPGAAIPGTVHLTDGRVLSDIHHVIVASGYSTSYPFLKGLESSSVAVDKVDDNLIITSDNCVTHNLHKDIFYIPDPTLAFVGVPYYTSTFSMFDFQAEVVARVFSGLTKVPSEKSMRQEYEEKKLGRGAGKAFHSLLGRETVYMDDILEWVNADVEKTRVKRMRGVDDAWLAAYEVFKATAAARRAVLNPNAAYVTSETSQEGQQ